MGKEDQLNIASKTIYQRNHEWKRMHVSGCGTSHLVMQEKAILAMHLYLWTCPLFPGFVKYHDGIRTVSLDVVLISWSSERVCDNKKVWFSFVLSVIMSFKYMLIFKMLKSSFFMYFKTVSRSCSKCSACHRCTSNDYIDIQSMMMMSSALLHAWYVNQCALSVDVMWKEEMKMMSSLNKTTGHKI